MLEKTGLRVATLSRLPKYLAYLKMRQKQGVTSISSTTIAGDLRLSPIQVRKDLAIATSAGRPKTGYPMAELVNDLEQFLGFHNAYDAFLVGAGKLGSALLGYDQFAEFGLSILAAFDTNPALQGTHISGKPVFALEKLPELVDAARVRVGIITVPGQSAQSVCDLMVKSGIQAIWNFTPAHLVVPQSVVVQDESYAASFAVLAKCLENKQHEERKEERA